MSPITDALTNGFEMAWQASQNVGRGETVRRIDDKVHVPDQHPDILRRQPLDLRLDRDPRIETQKCCPCRLRLRLADVGHAIERLAMEIALLDRIVIDNDHSPDTRPGKILQHRTAEPARTDHQHGGRSQARLSQDAHVAQHDLTGVTVAHAAARVSASHLPACATGLAWFTMSPTTAAESAPAFRQSSARSSVRPPIATRGFLPTSLFHSPIRSRPCGANSILLSNVG